MTQAQATISTRSAKTSSVDIERQVLLHGRRNNQCWFSPSIAAIPSPSSPAGLEVVINVHILTGNDIGPTHTLFTLDRGKTWSPPFLSQNLFKVPHRDDIFESVHTLGLMHHRHSNRLLAYAGTAFSRDRNVNPLLKSEWFVSEKAMDRAGAFAFWDALRHDFTPWKRFDVPQIRDKGACPLVFGLNQCCELADGSILMPMGEYRPDKTASVGTMVAGIEGDAFVVQRVGPLIGDKFFEPSIVQFDGRYFMTIRSERCDWRMYHAASRDGLQWSSPEAWSWDDGSPVETDKTQQHWMRLGGSLYLVYTRKSELNNGVYRFRAPLYMAQVNPAGPHLIRSTEQIVFPEKGARMGNFSVCRINDEESWIVTGEWLQQMIPNYREDQFGFVSSGDDLSPYNWLVYRGDLLLARVRL